MSIPAIADKPTWDLTWEELLQRLETCVLADRQNLAKNMDYFRRFQDSMPANRRQLSAQRLDNDALRLNLLEETLNRLQDFKMQALFRGLDMAIKHLAEAHKTSPQRYQFIITVSEHPHSVTVMYNPML